MISTCWVPIDAQLGTVLTHSPTVIVCEENTGLPAVSVKQQQWKMVSDPRDAIKTAVTADMKHWLWLLTC